MIKKIRESKHLFFLKESFRNFRDIGSIVPDSNVCFNSLLKNVPFKSAEVILEYGSAGGTVTKEIIKRKNQKTSLICFEKNNNFFERLERNIKGENVTLIHDDVFNSAEILSSEVGMGDKKVDCIVSTLPCSFMNFDELVQKSVLPLLKEDGLFIQYTHVVTLLKGFRLNPLLKKYFYQVASDFVFFNIPPTLIYTCRNPNGKEYVKNRTDHN